MAEQLFEQLGRDTASGFMYTPKFIESLGSYKGGPKPGTNEQRHHLTQDAAIIKEGAAAIAKNAALAVNAATNLHKAANATQALAKQGGKLVSELQVGYNSLRTVIGDTFKRTTSNPTTIYTGIFVGSLVSHPVWKTETAAHEFGHAIDNSYAFPGGLASNLPSYNTYVMNDFLDLDYASVGSSELLSTYRVPCASDGSGPFNGVKKANGNFICADDGTGDYLGASADDVLTNSAIALKYDNHIISNTDGWKEFYAEQFAFAAYTSGGSVATDDTIHLTVIGLDKKSNVFQCTKTWASDIASGTTTGGPPSTTPPRYCSNSITSPWTYVPYINKTH